MAGSGERDWNSSLSGRCTDLLLSACSGRRDGLLLLCFRRGVRTSCLLSDEVLGRSSEMESERLCLGLGNPYILIYTWQFPRRTHRIKRPCVPLLFLLVLVLIAQYPSPLSCIGITLYATYAPCATVLAAVDASFSAVAPAGKDAALLRRKQLAKLAQCFDVLLIQKSYAGAIPPSFIEKLLERIQATSFFHKSGDVDLRADEIANGAFVVVQWRSHDEIHERRTISSVIEYCLKAFLALPDSLPYPSDGVAVCFWSLQEATVSADNIISPILSCTVELLAGVDNWIVPHAWV